MTILPDNWPELIELAVGIRLGSSANQTLLPGTRQGLESLLRYIGSERDFAYRYVESLRQAESEIESDELCPLDAQNVDISWESLFSEGLSVASDGEIVRLATSPAAIMTLVEVLDEKDRCDEPLAPDWIIDLTPSREEVAERVCRIKAEFELAENQKSSKSSSSDGFNTAARTRIPGSVSWLVSLALALTVGVMIGHYSNSPESIPAGVRVLAHLEQSKGNEQTVRVEFVSPESGCATLLAISDQVRIVPPLGSPEIQAVKGEKVTLPQTIPVTGGNGQMLVLISRTDIRERVWKMLAELPDGIPLTPLTLLRLLDDSGISIRAVGDATTPPSEE